MSNMDLPPSSSDEEEAEGGNEDEAGDEVGGHAQSEHQTADAAQPEELSTSKSKSQS